jgi:hypothetical protein
MCSSWRLANRSINGINGIIINGITQIRPFSFSLSRASGSSQYIVCIQRTVFKEHIRFFVRERSLGNTGGAVRPIAVILNSLLSNNPLRSNL